MRVLYSAYRPHSPRIAGVRGLDEDKQMRDTLRAARDAVVQEAKREMAIP
jgi:hypothetical protein